LKGHTNKYRLILQKELAILEELEEGVLPAASLEMKTFIQLEMLRLNEQEELHWHQRSNENWLLKGDSNTYYFHKKANGKKTENTIFHLEKDGISCCDVAKVPLTNNERKQKTRKPKHR
jgi:hypothetical protein